MAFNNVDVPYNENSGEQSYMVLPYLPQVFYPSYPQEYPYYNEGTGSPAIAAPEVSSSSDVKGGREIIHSPNCKDSDLKILQRRIQNREAASRCRRKKMERISVLRETLQTMHKRCQELRQSINAVEAEVRQLKAAGYGQQVPYGQNQTMKDTSLEEPLQYLCPCGAAPNQKPLAMENQFQPEVKNQF